MVITNEQSKKKYLSPTSKEGQADLQRLVNEGAQVFAEFVAKGRNTDIETVWRTYGQGSVLIGQAAVEVGMVDSLGDEETLLSDLLAKAKSPLQSSSNSKGNLSMAGFKPHIIAALATLGIKPDADEPTPAQNTAPDPVAAQLAQTQENLRIAQAQLKERGNTDEVTAKANARATAQVAMETALKRLPPACQDKGTALVTAILDGNATATQFAEFLGAIPDSTFVTDAPTPKEAKEGTAAAAKKTEDVPDPETEKPSDAVDNALVERERKARADQKGQTRTSEQSGAYMGR